MISPHPPQREREGEHRDRVTLVGWERVGSGKPWSFAHQRLMTEDIVDWQFRGSEDCRGEKENKAKTSATSQKPFPWEGFPPPLLFGLYCSWGGRTSSSTCCYVGFVFCFLFFKRREAVPLTNWTSFFGPHSHRPLSSSTCIPPPSHWVPQCLH